MSITLKKIKGEKTDLDYVKKLYMTAFPSDERAPFFMIRRRVSEEYVDLWSILDGEKWGGFLYVVKNSDIAYVHYFAINEDARGKGVGTSAIKSMIEKYSGKRIFLAIEQLDKAADNYEQRVKRRRFYENCGLSLMKGRIKEATVVYDILGIGGKVNNKEYKELMDKWMGWPMKHFIKMEIIE